MNNYKPNPIDTSSIELSGDIQELIEILAENTHEIWAQQRMKDGWTYGEYRDDENKKHPCLVPYNELPESEKVYDRRTSTEALKCIIFLGYEVEKK